jgi:exonuclease III
MLGVSVEFCICKEIMSVVKKVEFIKDWMLYITLSGHWCDIIVLNVHAPLEDKSDDKKDRFYEELACVLYQLPKYRIKILLGDLNTKLGREDVFRPTIRKSLYEISNIMGLEQ